MNILVRFSCKLHPEIEGAVVQFSNSAFYVRLASL
jgi:hypothetical protein